MFGRRRNWSKVLGVCTSQGENKLCDCVLIISCFFVFQKDVIDGLCSVLDENKKPHIRIDGSTPSSQRQALVDLFQTTPTCRVAVLSITAAGVGLTLTAASNVFFAELFYNPGALMQAEDRAHRIGQNDTVNVQYLVARNTIDEHLFRILNTKIAVLGETLDGVSGRQLELNDSKVGYITCFFWFRIQTGTKQDRENAGGMMVISEDSVLAEVLNMVKRSDDGRNNAGNDVGTKRARQDENEEVDTEDAMKRVEQMRQKGSASASKFALFSFAKK
jgi:hypothetical protein